jgi:hypothetical protein
MWKWIAGALGLGAVGYGLKSMMDKEPRPGDVASVPFASMQVIGLAAGAVNPLLAFGQGQISATVKQVMPGNTVTGIVGAGIPVSFNKASIISLTRGGKLVA